MTSIFSPIELNRFPSSRKLKFRNSPEIFLSLIELEPRNFLNCQDLDRLLRNDENSVSSESSRFDLFSSLYLFTRLGVRNCVFHQPRLPTDISFRRKNSWTFYFSVEVEVFFLFVLRMNIRHYFHLLSFPLTSKRIYFPALHRLFVTVSRLQSSELQQINFNNTYDSSKSRIFFMKGGYRSSSHVALRKIQKFEHYRELRALLKKLQALNHGVKVAGDPQLFTSCFQRQMVQTQPRVSITRQ